MGEDDRRRTDRSFFDSSCASYRQNPCRTQVRPHRDMISRFESFVLGPGEKKVEVETDTRVPSTAIFTFNKEDHTLGNLIRSRLFQNQHVLFSAYKIPHPLVHKVLLRVQTDGQITPKEAVLAACHDLVKDLGIFSREFTKEYELRKMVGAGTQQNDAPNGV
ncbi:DNA-directed RNA polymerase II subunit RPB11 [Nannizzia gypsea CBS 118893]|uniref:DNA-directed RNA polymerase II subunit RPB11 n=1 Tax=Arthroderma gypseum (strain ATCC MYA-4604 / CBS 118893) TaxID=535722 RepID=E4UX53_ARTGP|nr:DNA-directed RNA polymerase II subunit RPB11 [Nannizzia gypsea CBS 118893]EFR01853.1 DNA-directed RNA polymerase II subunit RPB11 [Nannizzia gypsea CBS 118893]